MQLITAEPEFLVSEVRTRGSYPPSKSSRSGSIVCEVVARELPHDFLEHVCRDSDHCRVHQASMNLSACLRRTQAPRLYNTLQAY